MKRFLLSVFLFSAYQIQAQLPPFLWAKKMGGPVDDRSMSVAVDAAGNVYTTGFFEGTSDFDPGPGVYNLTSNEHATLEYDFFISKLDAAGNFVWAKAFGNKGDDRGLSVAVDISGNVYATGYFDSTIDFDPGPGVYNLTGRGNDVFILKLDAAGNFLWAKCIGNSGIERGYSLVVDNAGNVFITGRFGDTVDFDPGPGVFNLTSAVGDELFVLKLNSSGDFLWAKNFDSEHSETISVDGSGNVYIAGHFRETADFDPGPGAFNLTSAGVSDVFVLKLNSAGGFAWAKRIGGSETDRGSSTIDANGNVYITGNFSGTVDFDPGPGIQNFTATGFADAFILKLDTDGNFTWARQIGGSNSFTAGSSITVDAQSNVYSVGHFSGIADFDPGVGVYNMNAAGSDHIYILKLNNTGGFLSADKLAGGIYTNTEKAIVAVGENLYITGDFNSTVDFDPGSGTVNLTSAGSDDAFVVRFGQDNSMPLTLGEFKVAAHNEARLTWTTLQEQNVQHFEIEKSVDGVNFYSIGKVKANGNSNSLKDYNYTDNRFAATSFYRLKMVDVDNKFTISNVVRAIKISGGTIYVFPNPVTSGKLNLQISNKQKGEYCLKLFNGSAQLVYSKTIKHKGGTSTELIQFSNQLPKGIYHLELVAVDGTKHSVQVLIN